MENLIYKWENQEKNTRIALWESEKENLLTLKLIIDVLFTKDYIITSFLFKKEEKEEALKLIKLLESVPVYSIHYKG